MSAIYGVILNNELVKGLEKSSGKISFAMLNELSDSKSSGDLPADLLPEMK